MGNRRSLSKLFRPESVALVGCEPAETKRVASWPLHNLLLHRSTGRVWPVTPRHSQIAGLTCRPSLTALPEIPDLALVMNGGPAVPDVLTEAETLGVGAAIVFGQVDDATRSWISEFVER